MMSNSVLFKLKEYIPLSKTDARGGIVFIILQT